nr:DUF2846 domain-containing protein [uncultured Desulfuromonas sp.]
MDKICFSILFLIVTMLTGCATPQALIHPQQGVIDLKPSQGKASLVVIREAMFKGSFGNWSVSFDGREVSRLSTGNYLFMEIEPGKHSLSNISFVEVPTIFTAEEGQTYCFNYDIPLSGGNAFESMSESDALVLMKKYVRVRLFF